MLRLSGIELALATAAFAVILDRWVFALPHVRHRSAVDQLLRPRFAADRPARACRSSGTLTNRGLLVLIAVVLRRRPPRDRRPAPVALRRPAHRPARQPGGLRHPRHGPGPGPAGRLRLLRRPRRRRRRAVRQHASAALSPDAFGLFASLPLLLVAVAGGVTTTGGALFAGVVLGGIPVVAATWAGLAGLLGVLPGTMGITLGRNPDGVVRDLAARTRPLLGAPGAAARRRRRRGGARWWRGGPTRCRAGWPESSGFLVPFVAARVVERAPAAATASPIPLDELELLGLDRPVTAADRRRLDLALALDEVRV